MLINSIALHKNTRELLPKTVRKQMHEWLLENSEVKIQFVQRIRNMKAYNLEALSFAISTEHIQVDESGRIHSAKSIAKTIKWNNDADAYKCIQKALFLGRWFAKAGELTTIYVIWGIRP